MQNTPETNSSELSSGGANHSSSDSSSNPQNNGEGSSESSSNTNTPGSTAGSSAETGDDYSAGSQVGDWRVNRGIDYFRTRVEAINTLRTTATNVAVAVLICLLLALAATVHTFVRQVDKVTPAVNELIKIRKTDPKFNDTIVVPVSAAQTAAQAAQTAAKAAETAAQVAKGQTDAQSGTPATPVPPAITATVDVNMSSIGNSIVAVITVLVISVSALAIVLLKTTYNLSMNDADPKPQGSDGGIPLPGIEMVKAVADGFATVIKEIPKK